MSETTSDWVRRHVDAYAGVKPRYDRCAETLLHILERAAKRLAPLAMVQARAKAIPSFAGKILKKRSVYADPLRQMTDLAGVRVITHTRGEVEAICDFLERNFDLDQDNCVNTVERLRPEEFGYRSIHYIVSFREGALSDPEMDVPLPREVLPDGDCPMKAEVQVRTIFEHAWADIAHDLTYKSAFPVPEKWNREIAIVAALLEGAGSAVERTIDGLSVYAANYGDVLTGAEVRSEIETLEIVLEHDPWNAGLRARIGNLAITIGDWDKAIEVLDPSASSGHVPSMRDRGLALTKKHRSDRGSAEYLEGRRLLEAAAAPEHCDVDAICCHAATFKGEDDDRARALYRRAHAIDPTDPYPLVNFLLMELVHRGSASIAALMIPSIRGAIDRCRAQIDVGMNLPWAHYSTGIFLLLLEEPYESLRAHALAVRSSGAPFMIETSLATLERLMEIDDADPGIEWSAMLLRAGLAARFGDRGASDDVGRMAIVAGGCAPEVEGRIRGYRDLLLGAFAGCAGTIVSGGTTSGIAGLVGEVGEASSGAVRTVGYIPETLPEGVGRDDRYSEIRVTSGRDFTPLEPLTAWLDLLEAGVDPAGVRVLGIGGGDIAAAEYRIALALGARVAVIRGSGGAAARLVKDPAWASLENLVELPPDVETLRAFLCDRGGGIPGKEPDALRETLARAIHAGYRSHRDAGADWDGLPEDLKDSNRGQADDIAAKLGRLGYRLVAVEGRDPKPLVLTDEEVETLAEMEHARWVVERAGKGWKLAPEKNVEAKESPYLVSWSDLSEEIREYDRQAVRAIPDLLRSVGLEARE